MTQQYHFVTLEEKNLNFFVFQAFFNEKQIV